MNAFVNHDNLALNQKFEQLSNHFDKDLRAMWSIMNPVGRPCFNPTLLSNIRDFESALKLFEGHFYSDGVFEKIDYVIFASNISGVFNLGGDLQTFHDKIVQGDRDTLQYYADLCINNIWNRLNHFDSSITTVSLLQGQALGGGFEAALTADVIVAERGVKAGLPEILFNLFPGMGALSLISRKVGMRHAEEIVMSGKLYSAEELHEIGLIDILAEDGEGVQKVNEWVGKNRRQRNAYMAIQRSKKLVNPITYQELKGIADIWVDAALNLEARDLRMMNRLIQAQTKITGM